nr:MAG TPA: hypothetical protein [Caudoviricetes sp.]
MRLMRHFSASSVLFVRGFNFQGASLSGWLYDITPNPKIQ